jgi:hypothetical protein
LKITNNPKMEPCCRVSFVVTSRNDDHGGKMLSRFGIFADGLIEQANRYGLSGELIIVEWNPLPGPRLHEVLELRQKSDVFAVRFIEVPATAHEGIRNSDTIPLFQMIAKNVGIRRARGEFVVATNPDVLFSDALIAVLATGDLSANVVYRLDRHDVEADVPEDAGIEEQLAWCGRHILRIHGRKGTVVPSTDGRWRRLWKMCQSRILSTLEWWERSIRAVRGSVMALPHRMRRWGLRRIEGVIRSWQSCQRLAPPGWRPWQVEKTLAMLGRVGPVLGQWCQRRVERTSRAFGLGLARIKHGLQRIVYRLTPHEVEVAMTRARLLYGPRRVLHNSMCLAMSVLGPPPVHTIGCGEVTRLSRDRWFRLRAYPELPLWSMHIDSFLCYMAVVSGLHERVLRPPCMMFHMEHGRSWVVMTPEDRLRTFALKPWLDISLLGELWAEAYRTRRPIVFNDERWGLADWNLEEVVVLSGEKRVIRSGSRLMPVGEER